MLVTSVRRFVEARPALSLKILVYLTIIALFLLSLALAITTHLLPQLFAGIIEMAIRNVAVYDAVYYEIYQTMLLISYTILTISYFFPIAIITIAIISSPFVKKWAYLNLPLKLSKSLDIPQDVLKPENKLTEISNTSFSLISLTSMVRSIVFFLSLPVFILIFEIIIFSLSEVFATAVFLDNGLAAILTFVSWVLIYTYFRKSYSQKWFNDNNINLNPNLIIYVPLFFLFFCALILNHINFSPLLSAYNPFSLHVEDAVLRQYLNERAQLELGEFLSRYADLILQWSVVQSLVCGYFDRVDDKQRNNGDCNSKPK